MVTPKTFELQYQKYMLKGDHYRCGERQDRMLLLHGAGKSSRLTFTRMREFLCFHGISSASFDFIGHGETGGDIMETTLHGRTDQAAAIIKKKCQEPLSLIAASMGGYSAIKLTEIFKVENLVLLVPAVYTPLVYDVPFGPDFSALIRLPQSWKNSDAFDIITDFTGNIVIVAAESDDVIPSAVVEQLYTSAINARSRILHIVPNSIHVSLFPQEKDFLVAMEMLLTVFMKGKGNPRRKARGYRL